MNDSSGIPPEISINLIINLTQPGIKPVSSTCYAVLLLLWNESYSYLFKRKILSMQNFQCIYLELLLIVFPLFVTVMFFFNISSSVMTDLYLLTTPSKKFISMESFAFEVLGRMASSHLGNGLPTARFPRGM